MTLKQALKELAGYGTEQNRKVYKRHGVGDNMYGVSYANLGKMKKQIKTDHQLALQLWDTGNHDARVLATMIADPAQMTAKQLDSWVKMLEDYVITNAFAELASKTAHAQKKMQQWIKSGNEWIGRSGWLILAHQVMKNDSWDDADLAPYINIIEENIHHSKNRTKDAMNSALIAIGIHRDNLREAVLAAAKRIGRVDVDHGETNCTTPEAESYIMKGAARRKKHVRA